MPARDTASPPQTEGAAAAADGPPAIAIAGLGKRYVLGGRRWPKTRLATGHPDAAGARAPPPGAMRELWALRDLSVEVCAGEVFGVIGANGAGKSTLLKLLARITTPSAGQVVLAGRVGSLLEVGTGFHPELTGRENVFLSGAILGLRAAEVRARFAAIAAFAEVERFLDTPVKHYSSGMRVRLAFAVAAHLEPEILLIDEVLAVGDAAFQRKSLGLLGQAAARGRTVLFVSHNLQAVATLCGRALLLEGGRAAALGPAEQVVSTYVRRQLGGGPAEAVAAGGTLGRRWEAADAPASEQVRLLAATLTSADGQPPTIHSDLTLRFDYELLRPGLPLVLNLAFYHLDGALACVSLSVSDPHWHGRAFEAGRYESRCLIPADLLNEGLYRCRLLFIDDGGRHLLDVPDALSFVVSDHEERGLAWHGRWQGALRPRLAWQTTRSA